MVKKVEQSELFSTAFLFNLQVPILEMFGWYTEVLWAKDERYWKWLRLDYTLTLTSNVTPDFEKSLYERQ